ncbi:hypothetical protein Acy02nite_89180 [Actinoplanes cyaneus]|uniref:Uncharacterized protein n=1 Tax=Actinoplanes cyaneus TaxID=52696 RepID=A0A919ITK0_9ACTN|nr:hypothetical protein Acy02nite_89180 [Actinoplanes cyaneus]
MLVGQVSGFGDQVDQLIALVGQPVTIGGAVQTSRAVEQVCRDLCQRNWQIAQCGTQLLGAVSPIRRCGQPGPQVGQRLSGAVQADLYQVTTVADERGVTAAGSDYDPAPRSVRGPQAVQDGGFS